MILSKNFLKDYIDLDDISMNDIAEKMVFAGNEYESIKKLVDAENLVVGKVVECIDHPDSDHLHICQVDIGDDIKQIVCGAPNVRKDLKVIVAKEGAKLPGNITIKATKLAGTDSFGMLCSLEELGLDSKFLKEEDKTGIHELDDDAIVGENAVNYLDLDDIVIDFELTADRADLMNTIGMAYEVGALYNKKVKLPETNVEPTIKENISDSYTLNVETKDCPLYLGKLVKNVVIKESPSFIKNRLMACGIRPINNVVDISNYVMLEYGQPLHFFDADFLGNKVIVRNAKENEKIVTLDGVERELITSDIVIANENGTVALAGVMGGLNTEVVENTKNIFIESAVFNSYAIRKTSHRILRSEASMRYERGIDPNRTFMAINRAVYLLNKYASGDVTEGILIHGDLITNDKEINIDLNKINTVLGMNLTLNDVSKVFDRLSFSYNVENNNFKVIVPTRRMDVNIPEDLIEEIGRIIGYDNINSEFPKVRIKRGKRTYKSELKYKVRNRLCGLGLNQVINYSLTSDELLYRFVPIKNEAITVLSPMSDDRKHMRQTLINSLISVYEYNSSRNIKDVNIFEIGSTYYKQDDYIEENKVAGLLSGNYLINNWNGNVKVDFYVLKGVIENLLDYLGYKDRYKFDHETLSDLHPGVSCSIKIDNEIIGYAGKVHPNVSKKDIYVFEISLDKLMSKKVRLLKFKELSKYPSVSKDLAFVMDKKVEANEIIQVLKRVGGRLLTNVDVFDVYYGENVKENEKSIAFSLTFQNSEKTLTDTEINELFNKMIEEVESKTSAKLRS